MTSFRCTIALLTGLLIGMPAPAAEDLVLGRKKSEWIDMLKGDKDPKRRRAAVIAMGIIGPALDDVDKSLADALANDESEAVRQQILVVVGNLKKAELGKWTLRLGNVLKYDKSTAVRALAATDLGKMEDLAKPVLSNLVAALKDKEATVRAAAVEAVGKVGPEAKIAIPEISALLKDKEVPVRLNSVFAIGRLGVLASDTIPDLIQMLATEADGDVRKEIVRVLGTFGRPSATAVPAPVKVLKDDKADEIRQQAVLSLAKIGQDARGEVEALKACLKTEKDKAVRLYLVRAITTILGDDSPSVVKDYTAHLVIEKDTDVKLAIVQEFAAMGDRAKEALPALRALAEDVSVIVRKEARAAIEKITAKPPEKKKE